MDYDFTLSAPTDVMVDLVSPGPMPWTYNTFVYLLDSVGGVINSAGAGSGSCLECSRIDPMSLPAGDYTIEVTSQWQWHAVAPRVSTAYDTD
jgi:hypothetical protein